MDNHSRKLINTSVSSCNDCEAVRRECLDIVSKVQRSNRICHNKLRNRALGLQNKLQLLESGPLLLPSFAFGLGIGYFYRNIVLGTFDKLIKIFQKSSLKKKDDEQESNCDER